MPLASTTTMSRSILTTVLATWLRYRYFTPTALLCVTVPLVSQATMAALHPDSPASCDPVGLVLGVGNHVDGSAGSAHVELHAIGSR
jgi:hypothetical protein